MIEQDAYQIEKSNGVRKAGTIHYQTKDDTSYCGLGRRQLDILTTPDRAVHFVAVEIGEATCLSCVYQRTKEKVILKVTDLLLSPLKYLRCRKKSPLTKQRCKFTLWEHYHHRYNSHYTEDHLEFWF